ncbi:hypothetical protein [Actinophytocola sp.]|uniref:hypothetical protein n=1 Tax=Actinophytocola sp. TaxID=1872138 RepID=UPI002ED4967C
MRALLIAATAGVLLGALVACGQAATPAGTGQAGQSSQSEVPSTTVEPPSAIVEPTPPASGKPQNPSSGEPPVSIGPDGPVVPPGVTEVPASQIEASALPSYFEYGNKVWMYDGGFSLQLFAAASSSCTDAEAVVVDQSADSVKIIVRPLDQPQGGRPDDGACAMVMTPKAVHIALDTPLQDRLIVLSAGR